MMHGSLKTLESKDNKEKKITKPERVCPKKTVCEIANNDVIEQW
jgi:hypothetical protein